MRIAPSFVAGLVAAFTLLSADYGDADPAKRPPPRPCRGGHFGSVYPHNHSHEGEEHHIQEDKPKAVVVITSEPGDPPAYTPPKTYAPRYAQPPRPAPYAGSYRAYSYAPPVVRERPTTSRQTLEIGLRGTAGTADNAGEVAGIGAFLRLRNGSLGVEASIDSNAITGVNETGQTVGRVPVLGAAMLYLTPRSPLRLYGLLGGGVTFQQVGTNTTQTLTVQAGAGLDLDLSSKVSLSADLRALGDLESDAISPRVASSLPSQFGVGTLGISVKF